MDIDYNEQIKVREILTERLDEYNSCKRLSLENVVEELGVSFNEL